MALGHVLRQEWGEERGESKTVVHLAIFDTDGTTSFELGQTIWQAAKERHPGEHWTCTGGAVVSRRVRNKLKVTSGNRPTLVNVLIQEDDLVGDKLRELAIEHGVCVEP